MKGVLKYILSLLVIEFILCVIFFKLESLMLYKSYYWSIKGILKDAYDVNILRVMFYYPFYIIAFIFLVNPKTWQGRVIRAIIIRSLRKIAPRNQVMQLAFLNSGGYIFLCLLYGFILMPSTKEYFIESFFYYSIIATFSSPFILNTIPYYKRLVKEL